MVSVSIIIPTYNRKNFISDAIDSVLAQTFTDFELIIIDDGSTDGTQEYVTSTYNDPRINYIYQDNTGQCKARNHGLKASRGEYICFLDSDDYWPENKLEIALDIFSKQPEVDVVYGDEMVVDENGNSLGKDKIKRYSGKITSQLIVENFIGLSASMIRACKIKEIGGMDETLRVADDYSLWLRLSPSCIFYYLEEIMGFYRISGNQISRDISARLDSNLYTVRKFLSNHPDIISRRDKSDALSEFYSKRVRLLGAERRYLQGIREFILAFSYKPTSLLPWRSLYRLVFR